MPGTYDSAEQKSFVSFSPGEIKKRWDKKKTFPLLQATVTWQPPRNLKYHSAAAYIRDLCERHTVSSQKCSLSHRHTCTQCVKPSGIHYRGGREGDSCQASGSKRWWLLFWTLFLSMSKNWWCSFLTVTEAAPLTPSHLHRQRYSTRNNGAALRKLHFGEAGRGKAGGGK